MIHNNLNQIEPNIITIYLRTMQNRANSIIGITSHHSTQRIDKSSLHSEQTPVQPGEIIGKVVAGQAID